MVFQTTRLVYVVFRLIIRWTCDTIQPGFEGGDLWHIVEFKDSWHGGEGS
jgi:hypothetical protein